jgi:hypothetical protein
MRRYRPAALSSDKERLWLVDLDGAAKGVRPKESADQSTPQPCAMEKPHPGPAAAANTVPTRHYTPTSGSSYSPPIQGDLESTQSLGVPEMASSQRPTVSDRPGSRDRGECQVREQGNAKSSS